MTFPDLIAFACVIFTLLLPLLGALLAATHRTQELDEAITRHPASGTVDSHWQSNASIFGWGP